MCDEGRKMKKQKTFLKITTLILLMAFLSSLLACGPSVKSVKRLQFMEEKVSSPNTIEELEAAVAKFEKRVLDISEANSQIGIWYKMIATRYLDKQMYNEALKALEKAVLYYPTNQNLYYFIGVSAGFMAKASLDFEANGSRVKAEYYLKLSESAYKRAIELEPTYVRSLYGLSVLYLFDLNEAEKAIPLLQKVLSIETKHYDAMFLLARAYYMSYEFEKALDVYDKIISLSASEQRTRQAEENKKIVLDALYGD